MSTSPERKRVMFADILGAEGRRLLEARTDLDCLSFPNTASKSEFRSLLAKHTPVHGLILGLTAFGGAELELTPALQIISRIGVGFDAIDVDAMTAAGVYVSICAGTNHRTVAEHTISYLLALAKKTIALDRLVLQGQWLQRYDHLPTELEGRTILIIGHGRIGRRVAELCLVLGMNVQVYDPYIDAASLLSGTNNAPDLDAALAIADFVTVHCPKTPHTRNLIDARRLALLRPSAFLVNTARGGIVDESALYRMLDEELIAGAALDVFLPEPTDKDIRFGTVRNLLRSPHIAGVSEESIERMAYASAKNLLLGLDSVPDVDALVNPSLLHVAPMASQPISDDGQGTAYVAAV